MSTIINASPQIVQLGTGDKSLKPIFPKPIVIPTHVPVIFSPAAGGPHLTKELVDGARLVSLYGKETFDATKPYFTHSTRLAELLVGAGNALNFVRIIPDDNDTVSNTTIYIDVINDDVDVYVRNSDGSIHYDTNGDPVVEKTVSGYRLKVISEVNQEDIDIPTGIKLSKAGYMTNSNGDASVMYPILEVRAKYKGAIYNNIGFALNLPTKDFVNVSVKENNLALPYEFYMFKRENDVSTGDMVKNLFGSNSIQFVFKDGASDPLTNNSATLKSALSEWFNLTNPLRSLVYPYLEIPVVYQNNLDTINKLLLVAEKEYINTDITYADGSTVNTTDMSDFISGVDLDLQHGIINPFTATSTTRVPAFTYKLDDSIVNYNEGHTEIYLSKSTPVYLGGGKDGTITEDSFEAGVSKWMNKYLDPNSEVMDPAKNIENVLYDSGFRLPIKKELVNFISVRKDTFVGLSTREDYLGERYVDLITERAMALNLKARLGLAPESVFFGTPVTRGIIVAGSGLDTSDPSKRRYGLLMDIATKAAKMMGGTSWKRTMMFDRGDKNIITNYSNIQPEFIPAGIKPDLWDIGMIWPQPYDNVAYHFPAMQSVYNNNTSVLNSIFMAIALTVANKVAAAAWRKFTGDVDMTPAEHLDAVETYMNNELKNKFDNVISVSVKAMITDYDEQRGYSWTVVTKLYGNVAKTVMTHYIESWNKSDL